MKGKIDLFSHPLHFLWLRREKTQESAQNLFSHTKKNTHKVLVFRIFFILYCFSLFYLFRRLQNQAETLLRHTPTHTCVWLFVVQYMCPTNSYKNCFCTTTKCHECSTVKSKKITHSRKYKNLEYAYKKLCRTPYSINKLYSVCALSG